MGPLSDFASRARAREITLPDAQPRAPSLAKALARPGIVAELKPASPTAGELRTLGDPETLARGLLAAGAAGVSALTTPEKFHGSVALLAAAVRAGGPTLMKDFVVTPRQLDLAQRAGASAVLLILPLLTREHSAWETPEEAIDAAHARGLETLLEVYDDEGYGLASLTQSDMVGINNRDLADPALRIDPERAIGVLGRCGALDIPVLALSGAQSAADVRGAVRAGARGVLVGSALMQAEDPAEKLRELKKGLA
jgi:indole-3-glycerol phosphate synthase